MADPVHDTSEQQVAPPAKGPADEVARGRMALVRLAEVERELALARSHRDAKVAEMEERLGWFEENELDIRAEVERRPWLAALLRVWSLSVKALRRISRLLPRS